MKTNIFVKAFLILLLSVSVPKMYGRDTVYDTSKLCKQEVINIEFFLHDMGIDLDTRSLKGWMRVLNNENRRRYYGLSNCSKYDIQALKTYIKFVKTEKNQSYDRRLK